MSLTPEKVNELRALRGKCTDVQILSAMSAEMPGKSTRIDGLISQYGATGVLDEMINALSYPERDQAFREFAVAAPGEMPESERKGIVQEATTQRTVQEQELSQQRQEAEGMRQ